MVAYGQLVIGPPGSGKTTYCEGIRQILTQLNRPCLVINMDFGNDWETKLQYAKETHEICEFKSPDIDVRHLTTIDQIMKENNLGPNGALIYAYKQLASNLQWLKTKIKNKSSNHPYLIFDMPGQVELYTGVDSSLVKIMREMNDKDKGLRAVAVHLVDSTLCVKIDHYISALLISLSAQISLELPFINVLTKVDLIKDSDLADGSFSLEWFARGEDLNYLLPIAHPAGRGGLNEREVKFARFHERVLELVEDFSLTSFVPLNIQDKEMTLSVLSLADKANGYSMSAYIK